MKMFILSRDICVCNNWSTLLPHYKATKTNLTQFKCGLLKLFVRQWVTAVSFVQLKYMMVNNYCFTCSLFRILTYGLQSIYWVYYDYLQENSFIYTCQWHYLIFSVILLYCCCWYSVFSSMLCCVKINK